MREGLKDLELCRKFEDSGKFGSVKLLMKKTGLIYTDITSSDPTVDSGTWRQSQNWD